MKPKLSKEIATCSTWPAIPHKFAMTRTRKGLICKECHPKKYLAAISSKN